LCTVIQIFSNPKVAIGLRCTPLLKSTLIWLMSSPAYIQCLDEWESEWESVRACETALPWSFNLSGPFLH